ncbi:MAG: hypothetical protein GEV00_24390, partial [Actinophytocola sp.]|nr:hypothetical protein [Actinophytocola sp.]
AARSRACRASRPALGGRPHAARECRTRVGPARAPPRRPAPARSWWGRRGRARRPLPRRAAGCGGTPTRPGRRDPPR